MTEGLKNRGVENIGCNSNKPSITLSPCRVPQHCGVFCTAKYRGGVRRTEGLIKQRGLEYKQKQQSPIPPLSGGEDARKTEGKGRGLFERSEFRRPRRRLRRRTQKPDNCGGASWFVLLAVEKNEQITQISVTSTFFGWERKSLVFNLLPLCFRKGI